MSFESSSHIRPNDPLALTVRTTAACSPPVSAALTAITGPLIELCGTSGLSRAADPQDEQSSSELKTKPCGDAGMRLRLLKPPTAPQYESTPIKKTLELRQQDEQSVYPRATPSSLSTTTTDYRATQKKIHLKFNLLRWIL